MRPASAEGGGEAAEHAGEVSAEAGREGSLFSGLEGGINPYGAIKDNNLMLSAFVGGEVTNYSYACVSVEKLNDSLVSNKHTTTAFKLTLTPLTGHAVIARSYISCSTVG